MTAMIQRPLGEMLAPRQKWLLLASLMTAMFMGALDQTIMATAAPKIVASLGSFHLLSWVFTTYLLTSTVAIPLVGKLSDIHGRKLFLLAGMLIFLVASAGCGAAPNMVALITFRGLQGVGGGIIFSAVFATIGDIFSPAERGKYMGLFTGTFSLASVIGPTIGGLLTDHASWRWVFYLNVPVGAVALPAIWYNLPLVRSDRRPRIDVAGAVLLSIATTSGLLALAWSGQQFGWGSGVTLALIGLAVLSTAAFVYQEQHHLEPIIPFHLFRNREFLVGNLIGFSIGLAMMGPVPYLPTFLQVGLHASATGSGLVTTPQSLGLLITSIVGGQILSRTGRYKRLTILGVVLMLASMLLMLTLSSTSQTWHVSAFVILLGLGGGLTMPTMSVVIQNSVPHRFLGVATSSRQFFMQIGGVLGTALFGVLLTTTFQAQFHRDVAPATRSTVSVQTLRRFEDPTLSLDQRAFDQVSAEINAQPNGEVLLADARHAQQTAIATAIRRVFLCSVGILAASLLLALLLQEQPLRRTLGSDEASDALAAAATPAIAVGSH